MFAEHSTEQNPIIMTEAEYLAFEMKSDIRHEYANGRAYAMTGAGVNHNIINGNTQTTLNIQLQDKPCIVMSNDMRVKVDSEKVSYRYPDTLVICGEIELVENTAPTAKNPTVVIEILSPSTALTDHNDKLEEYIKIPSVQEYILISSKQVKIERFLRQKDNQWLYTQVVGRDSNLDLPSIDCKLSLARIYDKVQFED